MRPIPRFWTTADADVPAPNGGNLALRVWGWSTTSIADAARVAADRLAQVRQKAEAGETLQRGQYYPRLPLREETLADVTAEDGTLLAVVTRNRYGAEVLNTDALLIADIDLPEPARTRGGGLLGRFLGRGGTKGKPADPGPEERALHRVDQFAQAHPELGVHTYRTAAGLRVLVTGGDLPPGTTAAERVLTELDSDPVYILLCTTHETYRARLTPKPWRCGHAAKSVGWPYPENRVGYAEQWVERYNELATGYCSTHHLSSVGPAPTLQEQQVIQTHDWVSKAAETLPLA